MVADESRLPKGPVITRPAVFEQLQDKYVHPSEVSEEEWKRVLSPEEHCVCRLGFTEPAFSGILTRNFEVGKYNCRACGVDLFTSDSKYWTRCGWPTFSSSYGDDQNIIRSLDTRFGLNRTEVRCKQCNSHLGHILDDDQPESGERYCINSVAINFVKADAQQPN